MRRQEADPGLRRIHFHIDLTPFVPSLTSPFPLQNSVSDLFIRKVRSNNQI
jgi:hypothetical protein